MYFTGLNSSSGRGHGSSLWGPEPDTPARNVLWRLRPLSESPQGVSETDVKSIRLKGMDGNQEYLIMQEGKERHIKWHTVMGITNIADD